MRRLADLAGPIPAPMTFWFNPLTPHHSLRVTTEGKKWIKSACGLPIYHFIIEDMNNQHLLWLDRLIASPYYIRSRKQLELFGEEDAIMLTLHGGDLATYLQNLQLD